ncbi:MAG TPA: helix-turn-helix domain-containing protein [Ruminiclostridium sp.]
MTLSPKHSKKILITFILSYLMVLLIPILIGSIAYFKAWRVIEENDITARKSMLNQASISIDTRIADIQKMSTQISSNYWVQDFLSKGELLSNVDRYEISKIIMEFQPYKTTDSFIKDFYLYCKNSDVVITSNAVYEPKLFYDYLYGYKNVYFEEWYNSLNKQKYYSSGFSSQDMIIENQPQRMITFIQSIPLTEIDNPAGQFTILFYDSKLLDLLNNVALGGEAYIIDSKNNVIVSAGNDISIPKLDYKLLNNNEGLLYKKITGKNMVISYISSSTTDWKYVSVIPRNIFMEKANYIRNITLFFVAICFLLGIVAIYFLANRNYSPIKRMVESISSLLGEGPSKSKNEMEFIRESVISAFNKNSRLEQKVKDVLEQKEKIDHLVNKNRDMIKKVLMTNLIRGKVVDIEALNAWLPFYNVDFKFDRFSIILFHIDDCSKFIQDSKKDWELIRFVIASVSEEMANEYHKGYSFELDSDTIVLLMNFSEQSSSSEIKEQMLQMVNKIKDFIRDNFMTIISVGIDESQNTLEDINLSFKKAQMALDYKIVKGDNSVIFSGEIINRDKEYYYPIGEELQLINFIKSGDTHNCQRMLDHVFEENFNKRMLSAKLIKCVFFDMMSTAMKVLDSINVNSTNIFGENIDIVDKLTSCETVNEFRQEVAYVFQKMCEYINLHKGSNCALKQLVLKYVHDHFTEVELSQTAIAEALGVSAPYLSKFFKQEIGDNMIDYINKLRVEKIKLLLSSTDLSLGEIAEKVGHSSSKTLIRIFKQYEGVTPGKFRSASVALK